MGERETQLTRESILMFFETPNHLQDPVGCVVQVFIIQLEVPVAREGLDFEREDQEAIANIEIPSLLGYL